MAISVEAGAGSSGIVAALILAAPQGQFRAIWPGCRHLKQLPLLCRAARSSGVSLVYCRAASTLIGVEPQAGVVAWAGAEVAEAVPCKLITGLLITV